jgi:hypothetical protein
MSEILNRLTRDELYTMIHAIQDIQYELYKNIDAAEADAARLADELKIVLLKTGVVWEEAGEDSPALIQHYQRIKT